MELLLLMCLCVSTWTGKTSADDNSVITVTVSLDSDAILPCSPTTKEDLSFKLFKWTKDGQNVFHYDSGNHYNNGLRGQDPHFTGRVSFFQDRLSSGDASIQIQNVEVKDRGIYSCEISGLNSGSQTFNIELVVNVPTFHATEDSDVILPCSLPGKDLRQQTFDWKKDDMQDVFFYYNGKHYNNGQNGQHENFRNRVEFFQDQLQFGNASILIKNTKLTDVGIYSCIFPRLQSTGPIFYMKLVVHVCPKPVITIKNTADGIRVICSVPDVSKVEMEMKLHNSDNGMVYKPVEAGTSQNSFMFSVTKEDNYRCLVKQNEYCHQLYSEEIFVPFSGYSVPIWVVIALAVVILLLVGVIVFLLRKRILYMCCPGHEGKTGKSPGCGIKVLADLEDISLQAYN